MKNFYKITLMLTMLISLCSNAQINETTVLLRSDDFGMSHSVNLALAEMIKTEIPFNASVMMACPWVQEAADMLQDAPQVAVGIHLTLTSEFEQMKWGPIAGKLAVPSLVDERGYFRASVRDFLLSDYDLKEVEIELRAQIERAMAMKMKVDYLDHHMGIARSTPEIAAVVEKLADEYGLVISRYFDETPSDAWGAPVSDKLKVTLDKLDHLDENRINLFVFHTAAANPEINVLDDLNTTLMTDPVTGESIIGKHRSTELKVFLSPEFKEHLQGKKLITYKYLKENHLDQMKRNDVAYDSMEAAKLANQKD
jgi:predicted glycoside hydrolase/deacetylase ChbG (UPF0249 family)